VTAEGPTDPPTDAPTDAPVLRVLVTGAAGDIGAQLTARLPALLGPAWELVLADLRPSPDAVPPVAPLDITDLDAFTEACAGIDTLVHLAGERDHAASWDRLLGPNVVGAHHAFEAARRAGCRRVVFASSVHAVIGYPPDVVITPEQAPRPETLYGATKVWAEALAHVYASQHELSCLCFRIGWAGSPDDTTKLELAAAREVYLTYDDAARLVAACVRAPDDVRFGVFHATSANRRNRLDLTSTRAVLGYDPQDDAFGLWGSVSGE
jgi:nucleoside-diphosphate-sugar epimerase